MKDLKGLQEINEKIKRDSENVAPWTRAHPGLFRDLNPQTGKTAGVYEEEDGHVSFFDTENGRSIAECLGLDEQEKELLQEVFEVQLNQELQKIMQLPVDSEALSSVSEKLGDTLKRISHYSEGKPTTVVGTTGESLARNIQMIGRMSDLRVSLPKEPRTVDVPVPVGRKTGSIRVSNSEGDNFTLPVVEVEGSQCVTMNIPKMRDALTGTMPEFTYTTVGGNWAQPKDQDVEDNDYMNRDIKHIRRKCLPNATSETKKRPSKDTRKKKRKAAKKSRKGNK